MLRKRMVAHQWPIPVIVAIIAVGLLLVIGVKYDYPLYHDPVATITSVKNGKPEKQKDEFENQDTETSQKLVGKIRNGPYKNQKVRLSNTFSMSGASDKQYFKNNDVFLIIHHHGNKLNATIRDFKRDFQLALAFWITICLLLGIMMFSGLMAFFSVAINSILFFWAVKLNSSTQGAKVLLIFGLLTLLFAFVTLWIVIGFNRQMLVTMLATIGGTFISIGIALSVFALTHDKGMYYESMQYVTQLPKPLFLAECLLGSLGAVMDESTDIVSSLFTLKQERPDISQKQIFLSGRQIGKTIMGPLINVLFFIFMAETIPMTLLYLKNGNAWGYTFSMNMSLGMIQSLISGIGIVLSVPLASWFASLALRRKSM